MLASKKKIVWDFQEPNKNQIKKSIYRYNTDKRKNISTLFTVCEESKCPNQVECHQEGDVTFLIGGDICTRSCKFCNIKSGRPKSLEVIRQVEEKLLLQEIKSIQKKTVVLTSVTRDDNEQGLAQYFASLIRKIKKDTTQIEVLIPDFHAKKEYLNTIAKESPTVIAQNIEVVKRLSRSIRPQGNYQTTMNVFLYLKKNHPHIILKSSLMIGIGESLEEIKDTLLDLKNVGIDIITVGQYLQPSIEQVKVEKIYCEDEFLLIEKYILELKFSAYAVGSYVRSSFHASQMIDTVKRLLTMG